MCAHSAKMPEYIFSANRTQKANSFFYRGNNIFLPALPDYNKRPFHTFFFITFSGEIGYNHFRAGEGGKPLKNRVDGLHAVYYKA